jgi:hypothetical protein
MTELFLVALFLVLCLIVSAVEVVKLLAKTTAKPPEPSVTLTHFLLVLPEHPDLPDPVRDRLVGMWGELPVMEVAAKSVLDMAFELKVSFPDPEFDNAARMRIAEALHTSLNRSAEPGADTAPRMPDTGPCADDVSARKALEEAARTAGSFSGSNTVVRGGIYRTLQASGSNIRISDTIVLRSGAVSGSNASGTIYVPPGVDITVCGSNSDVQVVNLGWAKLARKAGLE